MLPKGFTRLLLIAAVFMGCTMGRAWADSKEQSTPAAASAAATQQAATSTAAEAGQSGALANLRSGTEISTKLESAVDAKKAKPGDEVSAKVTKKVKQDGQAVIKKGDRLLGRVTSVGAGADGKAGSEVAIVFDRLVRGDATYNLETTVSSIVSAPASAGLGGQSMATDDMMMSGPIAAGGGGSARSSGNAGLLGGATSAVGGATSSVAGTVGSTVGGAANSTLGGVNATTSAVAGANTGLATPVRDISLSSRSEANAQAGATSVLSLNHGNLRLEPGTQMKFRVGGQADAQAR